MLVIYIELMSKLKTVFNRGVGIDEEVDSAFSPSSNSNSNKSSFSERVLESQQKFNQQFQSFQKQGQNQGAGQSPAPAGSVSNSGSSAGRRPAELISKNDNSADFGRFDENFISDKHLDDFDETKNIENFKKPEAPQMPPPLKPAGLQAAPREDLRELATATPTPRRNVSIAATGDMERVLEELEDIKAQNSDILRRIQRMEEKLRR